MTTQQDERAELIRKLESVPLCSAVPSLENERVMLMVGSYCKQAAALLSADAEVCGEAVAHVDRIMPNGRPDIFWDNAKSITVGTKLYTRPQQAAQVPLTDETVLDFLKELHDEQAGNQTMHNYFLVARNRWREKRAAHGIGKDQA